MVPVRAYMRVGSTDYPLFLGYADKWPRTLRIRDAYTERTLSLVDGFASLARAGLAGQSFPEQTSGERFTAVLDAVGWPANLRDIDTGNTTVAAVTFAPDDQTKALEHLYAVADSEEGLPYIDASGELRFVGRHALLKAPFGTSQATFRDADGTTGIEFQNSQPSYDLDQVVNEFVGSRTGGVAQTASNGNSQAAYGVITQTFVSLATSDVEVMAQAEWKLFQFKDPLNRIESITVMPKLDITAWATLLSLEPGMRITVKETPPGYAAEQSTDYVIQHLSVTVGPGPLYEAKFTYQLWPVADTSWIVLDDPELGKLGVAALPY
jgi:hypothetical protein